MSALVVKRPWKLFDFGGYQIGAAADGEAVCTMWGNREEAIANAAYLTEAVNAYDTLRAENVRLRFARRDLAEELLALLSELSEADDVTDYDRQERIADLRAALELEATS